MSDKEAYAEQCKAAEKAKRLEEKAALFIQQLTWSCLSGSEEDDEKIREMKEEAALLQREAQKIVNTLSQFDFKWKFHILERRCSSSYFHSSQYDRFVHESCR